MSEATDPGFVPPNDWAVDDALIKATKDAVVALRNENQYGPRNREFLVFRASELGDLVAFRNGKNEPGGCGRKPFYSFWPEKFPARPMDAETLMNFAKGESEEEVMKKYLIKAGLLVETQVMLGAWSRGTHVPLERRGDARFPDRSRGLVRGKCDFVVRHPEYGAIPLEWKSCSTWIFESLRKVGPKGDNALQAMFYAHEMNTSHAALGYVNKESGDVLIFTAPRDDATIEHVLKVAEERKPRIQAGDLPAAPEGAHAAAVAWPSGSRRTFNKKLPDDAYYDRAWPCYTYAEKKKRVSACQFYEHCWGALPELPGKAPRVNPLLAKKGFSFAAKKDEAPTSEDSNV